LQPPAYEPLETPPQTPEELTVRRLRAILAAKSVLTEPELHIAFAELVASKVMYVPVPMTSASMPQKFALVDMVLSAYDPDRGRAVADVDPATMAITWLPEYPDLAAPARIVARFAANHPGHCGLGAVVAALSCPPNPACPPRAVATVLAEAISHLVHDCAVYTLNGDGVDTPFELTFAREYDALYPTPK
jgi:hypothetical protein